MDFYLVQEKRGSTKLLAKATHSVSGPKWVSARFHMGPQVALIPEDKTQAMKDWLKFWGVEKPHFRKVVTINLAEK